MEYRNLLNYNKKKKEERLLFSVYIFVMCLLLSVNVTLGESPEQPTTLTEAPTTTEVPTTVEATTTLNTTTTTTPNTTKIVPAATTSTKPTTTVPTTTQPTKTEQITETTTTEIEITTEEKTTTTTTEATTTTTTKTSPVQTEATANSTAAPASTSATLSTSTAATTATTATTTVSSTTIPTSTTEQGTNLTTSQTSPNLTTTQPPTTNHSLDKTTGTTVLLPVTSQTTATVSLTPATSTPASNATIPDSITSTQTSITSALASNTTTSDSGTSTSADGTTTKTNATISVSSTTVEQSGTSTLPPTTTAVLENNATTLSAQETTTDPCTSIACVNGTCSAENGNATCACKPGFTGTLCETNINDCLHNPCLNGGTCKDGINNYTCQCAVGYNGYNCSDDIDDCNDSPCKNGGTCTDGVNDFTCQCVPGYGGKNCSIDIDECKSNPCKNSGTCVDGLNKYTCNCSDGYNGTNCENDIDECVGIDCLHNGTCQDLENNYTCKCQKEWEGRHCNEDVDECSVPSHPCHRNANCTNTDGGYNCTCISGFEGDGHSCTDINECENTTICQNGATCFNTPGNYSCYCSIFWTGTHCETDINECNDSPCASGATCNNTKGGYSCECDEGYRGDGHEKCIQETLITVSSATLRQGDDDVYGPIAFPEVIYYFGKPYNTFYVNMNGYVTLGNKLNQRYPTMDSTSWRTFDFPIIAPLWSDIQTKGDNSGVSYLVSTDTPTLEVIGKAMNTPKPSLSIIVTWENAAPYPFDQNARHENASFQVIISKVDTETLLMFNYDQELFTWKSTSDKQVVVGYSDRSYNGVLKFGSDNFTDVITQGAAGINGRWIFDVTSNSTDWTNESLCLTAVTNASILTLINNARTTADPCPCGVQQIQRDRRFKKMDVTTSSVHRYISRFSRGADKVKQRCHYSRDGGLLRGNPDGGYIENDHINDVYHNCCVSVKRCNLFFNINPSDNCSNYRPPSWSPSWGDPHIKTIDGANYTFNARGEFILLQLNQTDAFINVQVRTELASEKNTDATVFVGLAAQAGGDVVEVLLNKTSKKCKIYVNGTMEVSNAPTIYLTEMEILSNQDNKSISIDFVHGMSIQIHISEILDIVVSVPQEGVFRGNTTGLLGNNNGNSIDDLKPRNDSSSIIDEGSSEKDIYYKFGLTWRVRADESLFSYNVTGGSYSFYNNESIKPGNFISDKNITDIEAYLNITCGYNKVNVTFCGGNIACIVDAAATCNESFGLNSKDTEEKASKEKATLDHMPPVFKLPDPLYIGYSANSTVTLTTIFSVQVNTNISAAEGVILNNQTKVTLNVSKDLRVTAAYLIVTANDSMGAVSEYRPDLYYCGCEEESQCDFSLVEQDGPVALSEGKFFRARCSCSDGTTGNYCEEKIDICAGNPCYENVPCNSTSSTPDNLCGPCPIGFIGDGMRCYDENECYLDTDKCSQLCIKSEGSYRCECENGYRLGNDKFTCNDINECEESNPCNDTNAYCENTVGSFTCRCNPGYHNDSLNCVKENYAYAGMIVFKTPTDNTTQMKISIKKFLNETYSHSSSDSKIEVTYIEIVSIYKISVSRRKRAASTPEWQADFVLHTKDKASTENVSKVLHEKLEKLPSDEGFGSINTIPGIPILVSVAKSGVYTDKKGGMCNIPDREPCDPISTNCSSVDGKVTCSCKQNFEGLATPYSCKDIDECLNEKTICQGGNCVNSPGSYTCNCNAGYKYDGSQACIDMCSSNPCQNGGQCIHGEVQEQYFCKCDDLWSGAKCEDKNSEAEKLKIIAIAVGGSIGAICLLLLLALFGMYRRHKNRYSGYRRRPLSSMDFDSSFGLSGPNIRTKDFPIDDDTDTAFSIPRPKYNQTGNEMSDIGGASYDRIESEGTEKYNYAFQDDNGTFF